MKTQFSIFLLGISMLVSACGNQRNSPALILTDDHTKNYWYNGEAELTSFQISQSRYGELRNGTAVMIFVTEDFSQVDYTKVNKKSKQSLPVLKMNFTKNFVTGIYPYSIMTSTFIPFEYQDHAFKATCSVQEWCGHVYMELTRKGYYKYLIASYFEGENKTDGKLPIAWLEDEIWSTLRLYPEALPEGKSLMVPSLAYIRLMHAELKAYEVDITKSSTDSTESVQLNYPELDRTLRIDYAKNFPREILGWSESYPDGVGAAEEKMMTSTGKRIKTIRSAYWEKNKTTDAHLRKELGLE